MATRFPFPKKMSVAFLRSMAIPCLVCDVKEIVPTRAKSGALHYICGNHLTVFRWSNIDMDSIKVSAGASPKTNDGTAPASAASSPPEIKAAALLERAEKLGG